ncbi:MAG: sugar phosphate isomerase/epimerase [Anaerolineaceae bacterium]|nr:sugar phosphate isomerase/epimerase [Anaerolineaceae bacterium]
MTKPTIGLQIYSIRDQLTNKADFEAAMKKLAEIGYTTVEIAGVSPEVSDEEIRAICDANGLNILSAHIVMDAFDADYEGTVKKLKTYGAKIVVMPVPSRWVIEQGAYAKFAKLATELGKKLAAEGITLCYHNHSFEFQHYDGVAGLETFYAESDPEFVKAQLDTCWVQNGGGSVVTWLEKLAGRYPTVHFKDYSMVDNKLWLTSVGSGNLDWPNILKAAEAGGAQYVIVEQDDCHGDPFGAVASSFNFLKSMGCK